jgi:hypothetical protein
MNTRLTLRLHVTLIASSLVLLSSTRIQVYYCHRYAYLHCMTIVFDNRRRGYLYALNYYWPHKHGFDARRNVAEGGRVHTHIHSAFSLLTSQRFTGHTSKFCLPARASSTSSLPSRRRFCGSYGIHLRHVTERYRTMTLNACMRAHAFLHPCAGAPLPAAPWRPLRSSTPCAVQQQESQCVRAIHV